MDTIYSMRVFVRVAHTGSFTAAAEVMQIATGRASRAVSQLENRLRTRLLNRSTRRLALTQAGQRYFEQCNEILAIIDQAEAEARESQVRPSGNLRIYAPTGLGQHYIVKAIGLYRSRYPEVHVQLTLGQRLPDLVNEGYDTVVAAAVELPDSGLISQKVGTTFSIVCASRSYTERHGIPQIPVDLRNHSCLQLNTCAFVGDAWVLEGEADEQSIRLGKPSLEVNTTEALVSAVREGLGVGLIPLHSAVGGLLSTEFEWILREYRSQRIDVFALYPSRRYIDAKIRTWVDFLSETLPAMLACDQEKALQLGFS
ncbi:LysR family transcriptional regulator [Paraburkholderia dipogonis]|uniref:LysR family transcriptional regulator n=1 Tax=Paraburkholderia dipogonis TaxID=1211383 RepID=A0A4Y8MWK3_9BURK|nr:LysR family transcriptional regulator [Paraburkholderia dipogonis]TFE41930.1 LysR family transcriptional regulator [Paraburkholderia dipogonis]